MTKHEFLDPNYSRERTTFADGTTVTVDWNTNTLLLVRRCPTNVSLSVSHSKGAWLGREQRRGQATLPNHELIRVKRLFSD
jgi:hypothetical protein